MTWLIYPVMRQRDDMGKDMIREEKFNLLLDHVMVGHIVLAGFS
jgi:hypothetical protein